MEKKSLDFKIIKFIDSLSYEDREQCMHSNNFAYLFEDEYSINISNRERLIEQIKYVEMVGEIIEIKQILYSASIRFCVFKGIVLSSQLYDEPYRRGKGDIDIYVDNEFLNQTLILLYKRGYSLENKNGMDNPHHVVLVNKQFTIEVHKSFINPVFSINEDYLKNGWVDIECNEHLIPSLNKTSTLLHLLYHLYMDICLTTRDEYALFMYKEINFLNKSLYRLYEIMLFTLKYYNEINWEIFVADILSQKLRCEFVNMCIIVNDNFKGVFPQYVMDSILQKKYMCNMGPLATYLFDTRKQFKGWTIENRIAKYVQRERKKVKSVVIGTEDSTVINSDGMNSSFCRISYTVINDIGVISIEANQNDIYINDKSDYYDTVRNDGVCLLIYNEKKYAYKSLFFSLINSSSPQIAITDISSKELISDKEVKAEVFMTETGYKLSIYFYNTYITKYNMNDKFYLGVVLSDTDLTTNYRKAGYIGTGSEESWYNPIEFLEINVNDR